MPWPEAQRRAIFLDTKRTKGEAAARAVMHEAGYGKVKPKTVKRKPPHLRKAEGAQRCGNCAHYAKGNCKKYNYPVKGNQTCDSWAPKTRKAM